jgi:hypothetical protein
MLIKYCLSIESKQVNQNCYMLCYRKQVDYLLHLHINDFLLYKI